jgi:hypothetical protein
MKAALVAICAMTLVSAAFSDGDEVRRLMLDPGRTIPVTGENAAPVAYPIKCSGDAAYLRFYEGAGFGPVIRLDESGKTRRFPLPNELTDSNVEDFTIDRDGHVHVLMSRPDEDRAKSPVYIVAEFDSTGDYQHSVRLDIGFNPLKIAIFGTHEYLLTGDKQRSDGGLEAGSAIFDARGRQLRSLRLHADAEMRSVPSDKKDSDSTERAYSEAAVAILSGSSLISGDDGRIYLLRGTLKGPLFSIGAGGDVRRIELDPPRGDATLNQAKISHGRAVIEYTLKKSVPGEGPRRYAFEVYDLLVGKKVASYVSDDTRLGYAFMCYKPEEFTFLNVTKSRELQIITATPK